MIIDTELIFPAILFQANAAPVVDGIIKPMKTNGYADSGADIGYALMQSGVKVVCPVLDPLVAVDLNWVFPDTSEGISHALSKGANVLWLNTVLYKGHPIEEYLRKGITVVGQEPALVQQFDDKLFTGALLRKNGLPVPDSVLISDPLPATLPFELPFVLKPVRGRGSEGVTVIRDEQSFIATLKNDA